METKIFEKYGEITNSEKNIFTVKLNDSSKLEVLINELKANGYETEVLEKSKESVKIKISKNLFENFMRTIKKYKEGIPPENLKYSDDE